MTSSQLFALIPADLLPLYHAMNDDGLSQITSWQGTTPLGTYSTARHALAVTKKAEHAHKPVPSSGPSRAEIAKSGWTDERRARQKATFALRRQERAAGIEIDRKTRRNERMARYRARLRERLAVARNDRRAA